MSVVPSGRWQEQWLSEVFTSSCAEPVLFDASTSTSLSLVVDDEPRRSGLPRHVDDLAKPPIHLGARALVVHTPECAEGVEDDETRASLLDLVAQFPKGLRGIRDRRNNDADRICLAHHESSQSCRDVIQMLLDRDDEDTSLSRGRTEKRCTLRHGKCQFIREGRLAALG